MASKEYPQDPGSIGGIICRMIEANPDAISVFDIQQAVLKAHPNSAVGKSLEVAKTHIDYYRSIVKMHKGIKSTYAREGKTRTGVARAVNVAQVIEDTEKIPAAELARETVVAKAINVAQVVEDTEKILAAELARETVNTRRKALAWMTVTGTLREKLLEIDRMAHDVITDIEGDSPRPDRRPERRFFGVAASFLSKVLHIFR